MTIPDKAGFCMICFGISDELDIDKDETGETVMFCQKCGSEYVTFLSEFIENFDKYFPPEIALRTEVWNDINKYLADLDEPLNFESIKAMVRKPSKYYGYDDVFGEGKVNELP